jgi:hypothetical protein
MRPITHLLSAVALLAASLAQVQSRLASDWQVFKGPDYGTRLEYPASIFSAAGQAETGVASALKARMSCPSTRERRKTAIHLRVI